MTTPSQTARSLAIGPLLPSMGLSLEAASYIAVSCVALGADTAVYLVGVWLGVIPAVAGGLGYALGLVVHYALSTMFVFDAKATGKSPLRLFAEFAASGLAGLGLTMATIALALTAGLAALPAKILAVAVSFCAVYVVRRCLIFSAGYTTGPTACALRQYG